MKGTECDLDSVTALFEQGVAAAEDWDAPLLSALILQDMLAMLPDSAVPDRDSLVARRQEQLARLSMLKASPMKSHLDSGEAFHVYTGRTKIA